MANYQRASASIRDSRQGCASSSLLFSIFGAASVDVIIQRFAADPVIIADLVFLDHAPTGDDGELVKETPLEKMPRAM